MGGPSVIPDRLPWLDPEIAKSPEKPHPSAIVRRGLFANVLGLAALVCGCAGQTWESTAPVQNPKSTLIQFDQNTLRLTRSERLLARFDLLGMTVGQLEAFNVGNCPSGEGSLKLTTSMRTSGLLRLVKSIKAEASTTVDAESATPKKSLLAVTDSGSEVSYNLDFSPGAFHYVNKKHTSEVREDTIDVPDGAAAHDLQSAILLLRSWRPKVGEQGYFYVVSGRFLLRANMVFRGMDVVVIDGAPRPAVRVDGDAVRVGQGADPSRERRKFQIWFSDDPRHVPVRISAESRFGPIVFDLLKYNPHAQVACDSQTADGWDQLRAEDSRDVQEAPSANRAKEGQESAAPESLGPVDIGSEPEAPSQGGAATQTNR